MPLAPPSYRLIRRPSAPAPVLDPAQRAVVEHPGGPLLVLAGPGTGKTTTLVEAVVERVQRRGLAPEQVLVLTFSRQAAEHLRDRITARLDRTVASPLSATFHSFCYALVRRFPPVPDLPHPPRLMSAYEQDVRLRELLAGSRWTGSPGWPPALDAALGTRGFAEEVRAVLSRSRELGLEPGDLRWAGTHAGRAEWVAAGRFFDDYLDVLDAQHLLDYAELVHRAGLLSERPDVRAALRQQIRAVFVDEYQDSDPAQVRLLRALAGDGADLVVVGDPDQSVYGFRGADVRAVLRFPEQFRTRAGAPAPVVALDRTRRFGPTLLAASRRVAAQIGAPGAVDRSTFARFRSPQSSGCPYGDGTVEALTFSSSAAEVAHVADRLRRAHLEQRIPWSQMAVLVRSGVHSIPALRRALGAAGVPVEVAADELPLRLEPAVRPLLLALQVVAEPDRLTPQVARTLLLSPLGDLDEAGLRRLLRSLREEDRAASPRLAAPSGDLLVEALRQPARLAPSRQGCATRARRLASLLARARDDLAGGAPPEQVLWALWAGTPWPRRLRAAVEHGGPAAAGAHRDLDAVCALFALAARAEERQAHRGVPAFLAEVEAQQIPGDPARERAVRGEGVRLLTAHRAKGLEWRVVVVAGVQEGVWPDLRRRGSLLQADRLTADGLGPATPASRLLAEERRLFYVAVTRAREHLVVTAVRSADADGDQPSRLLDDLGVPVRHVPGRPARPLSLAGVVSALRRVAMDPQASPALRRAAAARLARLADERVAGTPLAPFADPERWWGVRRPTLTDAPLRPAEQPLALSGSAVAALTDCPLRWFLSREAAGASTPSTAQGFGKVAHVLAQAVADGRLAADTDALVAQLHTVWPRLGFAAPWVAERERVAAAEALRRLVAWHLGRPDRTLLAAEHAFEVTIPVPMPDGSSDTARIRGSIDRLEVTTEGAVVVVDFKTSTRPATRNAVAEHPQLGLYQLAVLHGAADDVAGARPGCAGAELVQLRCDDAGLPKVQHQPALAAGEGEPLPLRQLRAALRAVRDERFEARPGKGCDTCEFARLCPARPSGTPVLAAAGEGAR